MSQISYSETYPPSDNTEILDDIINQFLVDQAQPDIINKLINNWITDLNKSDNNVNKPQIKASIQWVVSSIDSLINEYLNQILHHSRFKKLEASWRGVETLINECSENKRVKVKLLDINWKEVSKDISKAIEFDQSNLYSKIYSQEYGLPGGEPFGVILGDYEISHKPDPHSSYDDISTLTGLSAICAASFSPFISSIRPDLFGLNAYSELTSNIKFEQSFKSAEYIKWNQFRARSDSRFIGLVLPYYLVRKPYLNHSLTSQKLIFSEDTSADNAENYLWGNASYVFASILIREFINVGWFGHIRGVPRGQKAGGLVTPEIHEDHLTDAPTIATKINTNILITDSLERRLSDLGFIPLCQCYNTPHSAFYSNQSIQSVASDSTEHVNSKLSSMLQHILCGSRIAHYLKVIIRDKIGSFMTADECERYLQDWLHRYTTGREDLEWDEQARFPLREARVSVRENSSSPGKLLCRIYLKPHYQLDNMISELELVTELSSSYSTK